MVMYALNAKTLLEHFAMKHNPLLPPPGTVVSAGRGLYRHVGLLTEVVPGRPRRVISLNPGPHGRQVIEEDLAQFAQGQDVTVIPPWGELPGEEVLRRARSGLHKPYAWTLFNCEHFARFAHALPLESPQLKVWALLGSFAALLFIGSRAAA